MADIYKLRRASRNLTWILENNPQPEDMRWKVRLSLAMVDLAIEYDHYGDSLLRELADSSAATQNAPGGVSTAFGEN
jgi:hypothetical protein